MQITGVAAGAKMPEMKPLRQNNPEESALQKQIETKQKELEALSENKEMDPKEKLKKKQEIEAELSELNTQLQQKRSDRLQGKEREEAAPEHGGAKAPRRDGFSGTDMNALLSADASMKQASVQDAAAGKLIGKANVLRIEAKLDGARGASAEEKLKQAAELESRAGRLKNESAEKLGKALEETEKTGEDEEASESEKTEETGEKTNVTYTSDGKVVEAAEEREAELDDRA